MRTEISEKIKYIGVDDTTLDLFESQIIQVGFYICWKCIQK